MNFLSAPSGVDGRALWTHQNLFLVTYFSVHLLTSALTSQVTYFSEQPLVSEVIYP